jgi:hypothetical protein
MPGEFQIIFNRFPLLLATVQQIYNLKHLHSWHNLTYSCTNPFNEGKMSVELIYVIFLLQISIFNYDVL